MKRGFLIMTVLVVLAVLFASCSNGMSESSAEGGSSAQKVMVSLGVDVEGSASQKAISGDTDLSSLTYWYCATHNWVQDRPVHGDTDGEFILIPNYSAGANLGYFTAGSWTFAVEVRKGSDKIYSGSVDYNIYTGHASPEVKVTPDTTGAKGTITFNVQVPATGGETPEHEALIVWVNGSGEGVTVSRTGYADGLATYEGSKPNLDPGAYTVTFKYMDEGNVNTEGAAQAVNVFAGQTSNITGTIDGGKWHPSTITINAPGINYTSLTPTSAYRRPGDPNSTDFTAVAASAQGNPITYEWYINGVGQGLNADELNFSRNDCGMYDITCTVTDTTANVTASKTVYVQVGYKVTFEEGTNGTVEYGANSSANAVFAPNDIVSMSVTPANGYHVGTLSPAGEYDDATHTATFYMPAADTQFSVTFEQDVVAP